MKGKKDLFKEAKEKKLLSFQSFLFRNTDKSSKMIITNAVIKLNDWLNEKIDKL